MKISIVFLFLLTSTDAFAQLSKEDQTELTFWNDGIKKKPDDAKLYNNRGLFYLSKKDYKMSLKDLNTAISLNDKFFTAYVWRGQCYRSLGESNLALRDFTHAIQNKDKLLEEDKDMLYNVYLFRSSLFIDLVKNYDLAINDCNAIIKTKPTDPAAFKNRGICYFAKRQFDLAVKDFEISSKYDPISMDTYQRLKLAKIELSKVISVAPNAGPYTIREIENLLCMDAAQRKNYFIRNGFIETRFSDEFSAGGEVYQISNIDYNKNTILVTIKTNNQKRMDGISKSLASAGYKKSEIEEGLQFYSRLGDKIQIGIGTNKLANIIVECDDLELLKRANHTKVSKPSQ